MIPWWMYQWDQPVPHSPHLLSCHSIHHCLTPQMSNGLPQVCTQPCHQLPPCNDALDHNYPKNLHQIDWPLLVSETCSTDTKSPMYNYSLQEGKFSLHSYSVPVPTPMMNPQLSMSPKKFPDLPTPIQDTSTTDCNHPNEHDYHSTYLPVLPILRL